MVLIFDAALEGGMLWRRASNMGWCSESMRICKLVMLGFTLLVAVLVLGCQQKPGEKRDIHGFTEVHLAARNHDLARLDELISLGANVNVQDADGVAPLHRVARDGDLEWTKLLLERYADPNLPTGAGWTALQLAVRNGHVKVTELLLSYGARPNTKTPDGRTPLHMAVAKNKPELIELLLANWTSRTSGAEGGLDTGNASSTGGTDIEERDGRGRTVLHIAVEQGLNDTVPMLLGRGASINAQNDDGQTPLHIAVEKDNEFLVLLLLSNHAEPNVRDAKGSTPYAVAFREHQTRNAALIAQYGGR